MKWRLRFKNPIRYQDIERCPYSYLEEPRRSLWCRKDDERMEKIRRSFKRFLLEIKIFFQEHIERY